MTHQYRQRILVTPGPSGEPDRILWRGETYAVAEVLGRWHLRDRWWEARDTQADAADSADATWTASAMSDRYYYRLRCGDGLLCEVYWDAASGAWTLDRVLD